MKAPILEDKECYEKYEKLYISLKKDIEKDFGEKCKEFCIGCYVCQVWKVVDGVKSLVDDINPKRWKRIK